MFEDGSATISGQLITRTASSTWLTVLAIGGSCSLTMVAVGGGAAGGSSFGGGGGSGYITWREVILQEGTNALEVEVGEGGRRSTVWGEGREVLLEALPGELCQYQGAGGAGYSGGGGWGRSGVGWVEGGDGGSDGEDGEEGSQSSGGQGSGVDVSSIPMEGFRLR